LHGRLRFVFVLAATVKTTFIGTDAAFVAMNSEEEVGEDDL